MKSIRVPFSLTGGGVGETSDPARIAEQKIINTLMTNNGERVMNPNFGASTARLLFDINSALEFSDFKIDALQELKRTVSGVDIIDIRINESFYSQIADPTTATITVIYRLPLGSVQATSFNVVIPGQVAEDTLI